MDALKTLINEDWLAVILAFALIGLAAAGVLGPNGLNLTF
jgi:hypothetical protein